MYDEQQDRPPWLRNLRPVDEQEAEVYEPVPVADEYAVAPDLMEAPPDLSSGQGGGLTRRHLLLLAVLLWVNVAVLGCLCLLATQRVVP